MKVKIIDKILASVILVAWILLLFSRFESSMSYVSLICLMIASFWVAFKIIFTKELEEKPAE